MAAKVLLTRPVGGAKGGRGRGRGRGRDRGRGRGRGRGGKAAGSAAGSGTLEEETLEGFTQKPSKYSWVDASEHTFTERFEWEGEELPWLGDTFDGLTVKSAPHEWFQKMDAPDDEYTLRAANSEKYRAHRFLHDLDGPGKRCYDGAGEMQYAAMRMSSGRMSSSAQLRRVACIVLLSDSWSV